MEKVASVRHGIHNLRHLRYGRYLVSDVRVKDYYLILNPFVYKCNSIAISVEKAGLSAVALSWRTDWEQGGRVYSLALSKECKDQILAPIVAWRSSHLKSNTMDMFHLPLPWIPIPSTEGFGYLCENNHIC